jgi:hypothetical protein
LRAAVTSAIVEEAVNSGRILRFHVLRPTWHFVAGEDARWLLALSAKRVKAGQRARHQELQIDENTILSSQQIFREVLTGGQQLTRDELESAVNQGGISTDIPQRFPHLLMLAELDAVLTSGAWRGKQATYALLDERVPEKPSPSHLDPADAAAELARRYFSSHGPATIRDFTWWSGLTAQVARAAIEQAGLALQQDAIDGQVYWGPAEDLSTPTWSTANPIAHLLPNYDEYVVAYTDRSAIVDPDQTGHLHLRGGVLNNVVILNGLVAGGWTRELKKQAVRVTVEPIRALTTVENQAVEQATRQYADHLGRTAEIIINKF